MKQYFVNSEHRFLHELIFRYVTSIIRNPAKLPIGQCLVRLRKYISAAELTIVTGLRIHRATKKDKAATKEVRRTPESLQPAGLDILTTEIS